MNSLITQSIVVRVVVYKRETYEKKNTVNDNTTYEWK
jgi:hypothetical protein